MATAYFPSASGTLGGRWVGRSMRRTEDPPLLRGAARFLDDLAPEGALHAAFVRSEIAHGLIRSIDVTAAVAAGALVFVAADLGAANGPMLHPKWPPPPVPLIGPSGMRFREATLELLACDRVRFVGEAVALLPDRQRAVVTLRVWNEMTYGEIADVLGCGESTVRSHMHHGLASLRSHLEPRLDGPY